MAAMTLDTVYETYAQRQQTTGNEILDGSIEVVNDSINLYWSNDDAEPANAAAMTLDDGGPFAVGVHPIRQGARWVLVEAAAGAPVIKEYRVAVVVP